MRDYSSLTREELEQRLDAAEDVCVLFAWSPVQYNDRADAAFEMWKKWEDIGGDSTPKVNPHLTDAVITELSQHRQSIRAKVMDRVTEAGEE